MNDIHIPTLQGYFFTGILYGNVVRWIGFIWIFLIGCSTVPIETFDQEIDIVDVKLNQPNWDGDTYLRCYDILVTSPVEYVMIEFYGEYNGVEVYIEDVDIHYHLRDFNAKNSTKIRDCLTIKPMRVNEQDKITVRDFERLWIKIHAYGSKGQYTSKHITIYGK